ncbi:BgTH12-00766, partial [Blumeria graminis f. sp. triticale]
FRVQALYVDVCAKHLVRTSTAFRIIGSPSAPIRAQARHPRAMGPGPRHTDQHVALFTPPLRQSRTSRPIMYGLLKARGFRCYHPLSPLCTTRKDHRSSGCCGGR